MNTSSDTPTRKELQQDIARAVDKAIEAAMKGTGEVMAPRLKKIKERFDEVERSGNAISELLGLQSEAIHILRDEVERLRIRTQEFDQDLNAMKTVMGERT